MPKVSKPSQKHMPKSVPVKKITVPTHEALDIIAKLHREGDVANLNRWHVEMKKLLKLTNDQSTNLIAVGVKMPQHDRDKLLSILQSNL